MLPECRYSPDCGLANVLRVHMPCSNDVAREFGRVVRQSSDFDRTPCSTGTMSNGVLKIRSSTASAGPPWTACACSGADPHTVHLQMLCSTSVGVSACQENQLHANMAVATHVILDSEAVTVKNVGLVIVAIGAEPLGRDRVGRARTLLYNFKIDPTSVLSSSVNSIGAGFT